MTIVVSYDNIVLIIFLKSGVLMAETASTSNPNQSKNPTRRRATAVIASAAAVLSLSACDVNPINDKDQRASKPNQHQDSFISSQQYDKLEAATKRQVVSSIRQSAMRKKIDGSVTTYKFFPKFNTILRCDEAELSFPQVAINAANGKTTVSISVTDYNFNSNSADFSNTTQVKPLAKKDAIDLINSPETHLTTYESAYFDDGMGLTDFRVIFNKPKIETDQQFVVQAVPVESYNNLEHYDSKVEDVISNIHVINDMFNVSNTC